MGKDLTKVNRTLFICNGGSCKKQGAEDHTREIRCAIKMAGVHEITHTVKTLCLGQCENAPVIFVAPQNHWYKNIDHSIIQKLIDPVNEDNAPYNGYALYAEGWDKMYPAKQIKPKTFDAFSQHVDDYAGEVYGAKIYPWEFNTYPLLKEIFEVHRPHLKITYCKQTLRSTAFNILYHDGKASIKPQHDDPPFEIVMKASKEDENFKYKVSKIKIYKKQHENTYGLYMANSNQGVFLNAEWQNNDALWHHLKDNYVSISG